MNNAQSILQEVLYKLTTIIDLMTTNKDVLNVNDLHIMTGFAKSTIYRYTMDGVIPHYKQGNKLFFDKLEIENWLKENRGKSQTEIESEAIRYTTRRAV